jgi:glucuronate isomerase
MNEIDQYRYGVLYFCARQYARLGWVMQIHLGVKRGVNTMMFETMGPDTGFDFAGQGSGIAELAKLFDMLNSEFALPKTLIFSINPADNMIINTLAGCFTGDGVKGKVQQGSAWWFNDTYTGMKQQIINFAEAGLLANFVGMLTDSRSFLSYVRHEYFRRILCSILGKWADSGMYSDDIGYLSGIVNDICYNNAKDFFDIA